MSEADNVNGSNGAGEKSPVPYATQHGLIEYINIPTVNLENLRTKPKNVKNIVKSRQGPGGSMIQYVDWVSSAGILDEAFGPGGWSFEIGEPIDKFFPAIDPNKMEVVVKVRVTTITGVVIEAYGHGDYLMNNKNAHYAYSVEAAASIALNKIVARLAKWVRPIWSKDAEGIQALQPPTDAQMNMVKGVIEQLRNAGKDEEVDKVLKLYGLEENKLKDSSGSVLTTAGQALAGLL